MERFLIVNADDFGRSEAVNAGIIEGFRRGIVTSTSIVAMGPAFDSAVALARENEGLGIGIHLILNEYKPALLASQIPSLVTDDGQFHRRGEQLLKMVASARMADDVLREWDAQISKVLASGIKLDHIDGHGHCHAHPRVARAVVALAERYGISQVRLPVESMAWRAEQFSAFRLAGKLALNSFALYSRRLWGAKVSSPEHFYGFSEGGHLSLSVVRRVAQTATPGVSELMVHVGTSNIESDGLRTSYDWKGDLEAVTAFDKASFQREFGIKLTTFTGRRF
jgi:predicted glycoside hydrolase/deacetylase ChbG (UPF0249 family)